MDGFKDWLHVTIQSLLEKDVLQKVHLNLMRRAQTSHDAGLIKLAMQRFDKGFIPRSATSARHEFAGYEPPSDDPDERKRAADRSRQRMRKAIAPQQGGTIVPPSGFLPENPGDAKTREAKC